MRPSAWPVALLLVAGIAAARMPPELAGVLSRLPAAQRAQLERNARAWSAMSVGQRSQFAGRARAFDALPLAERRLRRERFAAWQALPESERRRLRDEAARIAQLAPADQAALRARFDAMDASTQRGWRLGPALGADYPRLHALLAQAPGAQHAALLRTLREMTRLQRNDLAMLVQRTPPARMDALRRELVATSDANRVGWLMLRLEQ